MVLRAVPRTFDIGPRTHPRRLRAALALGLGLAACAGLEPAHRLTYATLGDNAEGRPLPYGLFVPAGWDRRTPLPVVVLLHGAGDDETSADRIGVIDRIDAAIARGDVPPVAIVTPRGERGFWVDWADGSHHWASWVLTDVLADVRAKIPTVAGREGLHLVGVSMGGGGGLQMWLAHRDAFASATILSAPILDEDDTRKFLARFMPKGVLERAFGPAGASKGIDPYAALAADGDRQGSELMFGAAAHDLGRIRGSNAVFADHLRERGVAHTFVVFDGNHSWRSWGEVLPWALCQQLRDECPMATPSRWKLERSAPSRAAAAQDASSAVGGGASSN